MVFSGVGPPPDNDGRRRRRHVPTNSSPSSLIFLSSVGVCFFSGRTFTSRGETMVAEMRKKYIGFYMCDGCVKLREFGWLAKKRSLL